MSFFSIATIWMPWSAKIVKGWSKLDELMRILSSKHQDDFLRGRMGEVY
jgi:hypothetical protein